MSKSAGSFEVGGNGVSADGRSFKHMLERFNPGGIFQIDASEVVSDTKVETYQVLPQEAGLIQLIHEGALVADGSQSFQIVKKIRYPAGLYGAHRVKFVLRKGVPQPDGNPGHSCVFSEELGELIEGAAC
jgi:hypothetical protein